MCGRLASHAHRPLFKRGTFCERCCPTCTEPDQAAAITSDRWTTPSAPRPYDEFYFDARRKTENRFTRRRQW